MVCRKYGLDCDFVIKVKQRKFWSRLNTYQIQKHGMHAENIYLNDIPDNLLCHSFNEET